MDLGIIHGVNVWHDLHDSFSFRELLEGSLNGRKMAAALGPLYANDPADDFLAPFRRSANSSGWIIDDEEDLAPAWALETARELRMDELAGSGVFGESKFVEAVSWTRAGLVLELGSRWGIRVVGQGILHPLPKLRGSITGRFGYEGAKLSGGKRWNPLTIPAGERNLVVPSSACRRIAVIDFRGMDLCSMLGTIPGLREWYGSCDDPHVRTADLVGMDRASAKQNLWVYAYGGSLDAAVSDRFSEGLPPLREFLKGKEHGEIPRIIQERSAVSFRAALSAALSFLVSPHCRPMFAVHDEIVLDVAGGAEGLAMDVLKAMETGASERSGVNHTARLQWGTSYLEAKGKPE